MLTRRELLQAAANLRVAGKTRAGDLAEKNAKTAATENCDDNKKNIAASHSWGSLAVRVVVLPTGGLGVTISKPGRLPRVPLMRRSCAPGRIVH